MKNRYLIMFGQRVRNLREQQHLSREDLACKATVHRTYIGMIERGEKNVTLLTIIKLSKALGITSQELLNFKQE